MADEIKCPMCSKPNPAELDVCQYCEARLKPLTDELSRSQPPIHPGDEPTEMDTGQLEPILPQWLREVRQQARDSADEGTEQFSAQEEAGQSNESSDLLAGLQSQSGDDEEVPDWLVGLRGEAGQGSSEESFTEDDDIAALRNMLGEDTPLVQESESSALPGWVSDLGAGETDQAEGDELSTPLAGDTTGESAQSASQPTASELDFGWNADFDTDSGLQSESADDSTSFETELPAWLQGMGETPEEKNESGFPAGFDVEESALAFESDESTPPTGEGNLPDWLATLGEEGLESASQEDMERPEAKDATDWLSSLGDESESTPQQEAEQSEAKDATDWLASLEDETEAASQQEIAQPAAEGEMPDWLSSLGEESSDKVPEQGIAQSATEGEMPNWLSSLGEESSDEVSEQEIAQPATEDEMPNWLSSSGEGSPVESPQQESVDAARVGDTPDWLSSIGEETEDAVTQETAQPTGGSELPDWLSSLGDEESHTEAEEPAPPADFIDTPQAATEEEMPDWLSSMEQETIDAEQSAEEFEVSSIESEEPADEGAAIPAFVDDEGKPISTDDVESIFSMDMPDWLSNTEGLAEAGTLESADTHGDDLRPAELPSWVQAMRPVESVISETDGGSAEEQPLEERGPLAGLRGVLPAVPGIGPSSKPKAYSLKLQASEDQQANAVLLEQMLAEEIHPKSVGTQKVVLTQRLLRWSIAILLLLVVGGIVFSGTQINAMPNSAPLETSAVLKYVQDALPANAPVLLVFDYEAAQAGELEATAAPLIDLMLTLKAPRLSLLASTPTGSGLAERFIEPFTLPSSHSYQRGQQFINLGYLPGGAAGVLAFSENPILTKPLTTTGENAWTSSVLQDVGNLSEFKAIILLTSNEETARIWIEQTESQRGETQLMVVSSAQSGPMILPYVQSGQVDGMVTGLDNSAPIEYGNGGRPGMIRRYWDAYGFGLLTAVSLIVLGTLWSLVSGWQARRKEQVEE